MTDERAIRQIELDARVTELRDQAAVKQAAAERARGRVTDDYAFWTQPAYGNAAGRAFSRQRDRERARIIKAGEMAAEARAIDDKADSMERRGVVMAGDALAAHKAKIEACNVAVGMSVNSVYGWRKVVKVNRTTVLLEGSFGPVKLGKELILGVAA